MKTISVRYHIKRTTGWQDYRVEVNPRAYVLDGLEAAGKQDPSLLFRHACHHASCGSCGLRINGRESLPCITPLAKFKSSNLTLRLEPLRNFPIIGDLLVDLQPFMQRLDSIDLPLVRRVKASGNEQIGRIQPSPEEDNPEQIPRLNVLENCIECGLCMSACPVVGSDAKYSGPAVLAAAGRIAAEPRRRTLMEVLKQVDHEHGLWRCHSAFECTEVCPAGVDPAREIMSLRSQLLSKSSTMKVNKGS